MAAPIRYGEIQVATVNGKVKLMCHITPKVKMAVNRFEGNNEIYVHLNCKQKSISMMLSDFEEVCAVYDTIKQKLHVLQQENNQQVPAQGVAPQGQGFAPQGQGFASPQAQGFASQGQGFAPPQAQGFATQGQRIALQAQGFALPQAQAQGYASQAQGQEHAQPQDVWDEIF